MLNEAVDSYVSNKDVRVLLNANRTNMGKKVIMDKYQGSLDIQGMFVIDVTSKAILLGGDSDFVIFHTDFKKAIVFSNIHSKSVQTIKQDLTKDATKDRD